MGLKVVSIQDRNPSRALPTIHGVMILLDSDTGEPMALLEAERLTAIRTGAASGLATDLLAEPDASVAAIFGAGRQAMAQLEAVSHVRPLRHVQVHTRTPETALTFASTMSSRLGIDVVPADSRDALREAEIICTATTAAEPIFDPDAVRPGAHINAIGTFTPDTVEIPPELVARARVVVDQRSSCLEEAGELVHAIRRGLMDADDIHAEIGEIAAGTAKGRSSAAEITLFKSVGNAVQDLVAAAFVFERASAMGLGTTVSF
jgi:ornithine cyclodeaminase